MPPVKPRPAASLVLLRDRDGLEVLVGRRESGLRAFPGATVFPGGKLEPEDATWPGGDGRLATAAHAAIRETFEETGVLIARTGRSAGAGAGGGAFARSLATRGLEPAPERLAPFSHWITPPDQPYRFDTHFFMAVCEGGEAETRLVPQELEVLRWARPAGLLASAGGEILLSPTRHALNLLLASPTAHDAWRAAKARGLVEGGAWRS